MLWDSPTEPLVVDRVEYRNVWMKDDPEVLRDALAKRMTPVSQSFQPGAWSRNLCVAGYRYGTLVALAVIEVRFSRRVRANMGYLSIFIAPETRERGIAIPLSMRTHEIMRQYSLANPEKRIGGVMAVVTVKGILGEPVTKAFQVLAGYTPKNEPVIVRWFEHYKL
jgi:hypothetical protein